MKITHLQLTQAIYVPGYKQFTRTTLTTDDTSMKISQHGVMCNIGKHTFLIPWHIVQVAVLSEETNAKESIKAA